MQTLDDTPLDPLTPEQAEQIETVTQERIEELELKPDWTYEQLKTIMAETYFHLFMSKIPPENAGRHLADMVYKFFKVKKK